MKYDLWMNECHIDFASSNKFMFQMCFQCMILMREMYKLRMNECHIDFASSSKFMFQMCFQCIILMCETYKLWMNEFCMISNIKSWDVKFVMMVDENTLRWTLYVITL
jgi:hypothetical protein